MNIKKESAVQATKNLCDMFSEIAITFKICQRWFEKFRKGDFSKDISRSGRSSHIDGDVLRTMIENKQTLKSIDAKIRLEFIKQPQVITFSATYKMAIDALKDGR